MRAAAFPSLTAEKQRLRERHGIDIEESFRRWLGDLTGRDADAVEQLIGRAQEPNGGGAAVLAPGEISALEAMAAGHTTRSAAAELGRSSHTIAEQLRHARLKLGAVDTTHAVAIAIRTGRIQPPARSSRATATAA